MPALYTAVPRVYPTPESPAGERFVAEVIERSMRQPMALGFFGDSQETPVAEGRYYCPRLAVQLAAAYGFVGATGWSIPGSAACPMGFLRGANAGTSGTPTGLTDSDFPPGFEFPIKVTNAGTISWCLHPDGIGAVSVAGTVSEAQYTTPLDLIDTASGDQWVADILFISRAYTSEATFADSITWEIRKHTGSIPNVSGTLVSTGTPTGLDLNNGSVKKVVRVTTSAFTLDPANKYTTLVVTSANANPVVPIAARFRNITRPGGIHVTWFSTGGDTYATFASTYNNCGPILRAMELDAMGAGYGVNDAYAGAGTPAATVKANALDLISRIRSLTGRNLAVALFTDAWRPEDNATEAGYFNEQAGAFAEIADRDPLVRVCNSRLVTEKLGWTKASEDIAGLTGGSEWAVTTAYTTSNYVIVTGGDVLVFKCILNHTSAASDKPMTGANWRTYWQLVRKHGLSAADGVHHSFFGGNVKADVDVSLLLATPRTLNREARIPRGAEALV